MKRILSMVLALVLLLGVVGTQATASTAVSFDTSEFENPSSEYWPYARYVIAGDFDGDNEEHLAALEEEIRGMYASGINGLELEVTTLVYGSSSWTNALKLIYTIGNELGMEIELRVGGCASISGGTPQAIASAEIVTIDGGSVFASGTELTGTVEVMDDMSFTEGLIAVLAVQYTTDSEGVKVQTGVTQLDLSDFTYESISEASDDEVAATGVTAESAGGFGSVSTITNDVVITYTGDDLTIGEDGETWDIIAYYISTDGDIGGLDFTDFFTVDSAEIICANTDALFDDELKALISENGGYFTVDGGDHNQNFTDDSWSSDLVAKVSELYDYDFIDYLAIKYSGYTLEDEADVERIDDDFVDAMTYCFVDFLNIVEEWAQTEYDSGTRMQIGYCTDLDVGIVTQYVSQADVESYWSAGGDTIDDYNLNSAYKAVTSVSNVLRRQVTAGNEIAAASTTPNNWSEYLLTHVNKSIYSGVSLMVYHIASCKVGTSWAFGYNSSMLLGGMMTWNDANPQYVAGLEFNMYVARLQYILQAGTAEKDFVLYDHTIEDDYETSYIVDTAIEEAGYTYDIFSPAVMATENGSDVADGVIDPTGGSYKAFVISNLLNGDTMPLETAEIILNYAENGVPIIVIGEENIPTKTMSLSEADEDAELAAIFDEIDDMGMLTVVDSQADLPEALASLGVEAATKKDESSRIVSNKSVIDDVSYYYLYNYAIEGASDTITQTIYLEGEGTPYYMDLWSGEVTPVANYQVTDDGYIAIEVTLEANEACVYAIAASDEAVYATDLTSSVAYDEDGNLVLQATEAGDYSVTLSDGTTAEITVDSVADAIELTSWELSVESWYTDDYTSTDLSSGYIGLRETLETVTLDSLVSWSEIAEIGGEVSGVGTYTTTFTIDGDYDGAVLSLGEVFDTVLVYVNDTQMYINMVDLTVDISSALVEGENTLVVVAPSDLFNVLIANYTIDEDTTRAEYTAEEFAALTPKDYGLLGPVVITPYVNAGI